MVKFTVFTPTNDPTWLGECYQSLIKQTHDNWEWVLVPNGFDPSLIPQAIVSDNRVRIFPSDHTRIGALKNFACTKALGDILVELDHDDILVSWAMESMAKRHEAEGPAFHYSDFAVFFPNGSPEIYGSGHNWKTYDFTYEGKPYVAHRCFPHLPSAISQVYYAPNHVRAWHRDVYKTAGGHDASMEVGDDHELICRTYLSGAKFIHHAECLYLYRRVLDAKKNNSFVKKGEDIVRIQNNTYNKYLHRLCEEWCRRENLLMIDLGGAPKSRKGYQSLDSKDADIIHAVGDGPLPFKDNSVGILRAHDFLQRIPKDRFIDCMNDFYRVLAPAGWILSATPSSDGRAAIQDPRNINYINQNSFWYYTDRSFSKFVPEITCRFQAARLWTDAPTEFHKTNQMLYVFADLCALKGQHQPGACKI